MISSEQIDTTTIVGNKEVTVTIVHNPVDINEQRRMLFKAQENAVQNCYQALHDNDLMFYITNKKSQFVEIKRFIEAESLNIRDNVGLEQIKVLLNSLHVVDDLLLEIVKQMPAQRPVGWVFSSQNQNYLNLPTTIPVRPNTNSRKIERSISATILQFFGVACFSEDKSYFVGNMLGYLFCCYFFAYLQINYSVNPLKEKIAKDYPYQWVNVAQSVRMLQEIDEPLKQKIYQLAVFSAQASEYNIDKRIEKMLINEVNSFNKNDIRDALSDYILFDNPAVEGLFQPLKPLK